jgi:hypothetical protein
MTCSFCCTLPEPKMGHSFNNTFANRALLAVLALLVAFFYLLYRRKGRLDRAR